MAVTRAQVNAGKAQILDRVFIRYPEHRLKMVRIAVQLHKAGNATEKEVAKAILREAYQASFGVDPVGRHHFAHWIYDALDEADDQTTGVSIADRFNAEVIAVT